MESNNNLYWEAIVPVLPSQDIGRDSAWYNQFADFDTIWQDNMYAVLRHHNIFLHLQWHADTADDPLLGGSVVRLYVKNIQPVFARFVQLGTVSPDKLRMNTPWGTHEFGFYDLNRNAIFIVQDID